MNKPFAGHLASLSAGAINDNIFRHAGKNLILSGAIAGLGQASGTEAGALLGLFFIVPFLLFAPLAGTLSDRFPKQTLIRAVRLIEPALCLLGILAIAQEHSLLLHVAVCGFGIQSALFAPVKYAVIPELVAEKQLEQANGRLQAATNASILIGIACAALIDPELPIYTGSILSPTIMLCTVSIIVALCGIAGAFVVRTPDAANPTTPIRPLSLLQQFRVLSCAQGLWIPALCIGGFWTLAAVIDITMTNAAVQAFGLSTSHAIMINGLLAVAMGLAAISAPRFINRAWPAGLPCVGAGIAGFGVLAMGQAITQGSLSSFLISLTVAGMGGSLWLVPLNVLLQQRAPLEKRGQVFAASSLIGTVGLILGFSFLYFASAAGDATLLKIFGCTILGILLIPVCVYRHHLAAWAVTMIVRFFFKIKLNGAEHLPKQGGCLIVCNHVSYADGVVLAAALPRPGRFLIFKTFIDMPVIGFFLRAMGAIPIDGGDKRRALVASIDLAVEAAKNGEVVVIFPEGKLSRSGQMDRFQGGMERIAARAGVPVIPAHLDGLYGTFTSRSAKRAAPHIRRKVALRLGTALDAETTAAHAQQAVQALGYDNAQARIDHNQATLGAAFLCHAKRHPFRTAVVDAQGSLNRLQLASAALALIPKLGLTATDKTIGIMLPPGRAGTIINLAVALSGRTAVNLNHTVGADTLHTMCERAEISTVISSKLYMRKIKAPETEARTLYAEELLPSIKGLPIIYALLKTILLPSRILDVSRADDIATIIFSSGSTGTPKGVQLTHKNILANCDAVISLLNLRSGEDVILSPLPLFHSFGLTPGMWLGLTRGFAIAGQANPMDGKALGALAQQCSATFLLGTPTFARTWMRRIEPEQFSALRFAVVGAEKCPADLREQFKDRYQADLLEGYGCTEMSPVVACNIPNTARDGIREPGSRDGSIGRPLPGINMFTVHPETLDRLNPQEEGLLIARSPSRMAGYLGQADKTQEAFIHGGYNTGDIGRIDKDGFVYITGRMARFAKIGGEMVPLDNVEEALLSVLPEEDECQLAVAAVPDNNRGERLIVLHTTCSISADDILKTINADNELPPIFRPKTRDFFQVDKIPLLGTGKRDLAQIKKLAEELAT